MIKLYFSADMINGLTMIEKPETDLNLCFCFDADDVNYYLKNMSHDDTEQKPFSRVLCCDLSVIDYMQTEYGFKTDLDFEVIQKEPA